MRLEGKVAIVTGAAQGIGYSIAERFLAEGASVALVDIQGPKVEQAAAAIRSDRALAITADVADEAAIERIVQTTVDRFGTVDIVVNNAGISPKRNGKKVPVVELEKSEWDRVLAVNLTAPFLLTKQALPYMMARRAGRVINIASPDARSGSKGASAHYPASGGALIAFSKTVAREVGPAGVTVNVIAPGPIRTAMTRERIEADPGFYKEQVPLGRAGEPEEVASVALFLASDESSFITGAILDVNGGFLMP